MLFGFIGRISSAAALQVSLDESTMRTRAIAGRVAGATLAAQNGFALPTEAAETAKVNLEQEMVSLADEQLRFEATAKLLERTYAQIRSSLQNR